MRLFVRAIASVSLFTLTAFAQPVVNTGPAFINAVGAQIPIEVGPDFQTWTNENGSRVVDIASGMNFWDGQKWSLSDPSFEVAQNGSAVLANRVQHKVRLAANLNVVGSVSVTTPDGLILNSCPICIGLYDAASGNFLSIASITNCTGFLANTNQVVYSNAFDAVCADVWYTVERGAFHQDVVLTGKLNPADYGFPTNTTRIQIISEFYNSPQPDVVLRPIYVERNQTVRNQMVSPDLVDSVLGFGELVMGAGRAYTAASSPHGGARVAKEFVTANQRYFLVESVPYLAVQREIQSLPQCQTAINQQGAMLKSKKGTAGYAALPSPPRIAKQITANWRSRSDLAKNGTTRPKGVVIDYLATLGGTITGATNFQSDTTYFVSGTVNVNGTATIEGGAVFKYPKANYSGFTGSSLQLNSTLILATSSYRPAVFTAADDNTAGTPITTNIWSGYTGVPGTNRYAWPAIALENCPPMSNLRFSYAEQGIYVSESSTFGTVEHSQFINCVEGVDIAGGSGSGSGITVSAENCLFANVQYPINEEGGSGNAYNFSHCTFDNAQQVYTTYNGSTANAINCIFANSAIDTSVSTGNNNGFYNSSGFGMAQYVSSVSPFLSVGAANYYLPTNSSFGGVGTTSEYDGSLLSAFKQKTTFAPIVLAYQNLSSNLTLAPQAKRYTNGNPNLGYYYDPIDYAVGAAFLTNATITVLPGTVIGGFDTNGSGYALAVGPGAELFSQGSPTNLIRVVNYNTVQEQSISNWSTPSQGLILPNWYTNGPASIINFQFADFSVLADDTAFVYAVTGNTAPINLQDSQFHGGSLTSTNPTVNLTNCLLERVTAKLWSSDGNTPVIRNNLFWHGTNDIQFPGMTNAVVQDNFFDKTGINDHGSSGYFGGYNGYVTNFNHLTLTSNDVILTDSPAYQAAALGTYYLPSSSGLLNQGSAAAYVFGMYGYTILTNQIPEGTHTISIGYHYVAVDGSGKPLDANNDQIPDYVENWGGPMPPAGWLALQFGAGYSTNLNAYPGVDPDGDGLQNFQEYLYGTKPLVNEGTNIWVASPSSVAGIP